MISSSGGTARAARSRRGRAATRSRSTARCTRTSEHAAHLGLRRRGAERAGRQLDDEGRAAGEAVVLPVRARPVRPADAGEPQARGAGVDTGRRDARAPGADEILGLVVPDRELGADPQDQRTGQARLALGERVRARILGPARAGPPAGGEAPVEVDAVRVLPLPEREAVRVEVRDDPEVEVGAAQPLEKADRREPGALVPVDAAHDEHRRVRGVTAQLERADRPPLRRASQEVPRGRGGRLLRGSRGREQGDAEDDGTEQHRCDYRGARRGWHLRLRERRSVSCGAFPSLAPTHPRGSRRWPKRAAKRRTGLHQVCANRSTGAMAYGRTSSGESPTVQISSASPVRTARPSAISTSSTPPASVTVTGLVHQPLATAAAAAATELVPEDCVSPAPRSHTPTRSACGPSTATSWTFVRSGKRGWRSTSAPIRTSSARSGSRRITACGLPTFTGVSSTVSEPMSRSSCGSVRTA